MKYIKLMIALVVMAFCGQVSAQSSTKNFTYIEGVEVLDDGGFILYLPLSSSSRCKDGGRVFKVVPNTNHMTIAGASNLLSLALAAFKERATVNVWYDAIANECFVRKIQLKKY